MQQITIATLSLSLNTLTLIERGARMGHNVCKVKSREFRKHIELVSLKVYAVSVHCRFIFQLRMHQ